MASEEKAPVIPQVSEEEMRQQLAMQNFTRGQKEVQMLATRAAEMEMQKTEMEQVIEILKSVPKDRRTWFSQDGILIEMTAHTVIPKLMDQKALLCKQMDDTSKEVDSKQNLLADFAIKEKLITPVYKEGDKKKPKGRQLPAVSEDQ